MLPLVQLQNIVTKVRSDYAPVVISKIKAFKLSAFIYFNQTINFYEKAIMIFPIEDVLVRKYVPLTRYCQRLEF